MAQDGNATLKQILGVCVQINKKMDNSEGTVKGSGKSDPGAGPLSDMFGRGSSTKKAKEASKIVKDVFESIVQFNKVKINDKRINRTSIALKGLFDTIVHIGQSRRAVLSALKLFDMLAKSLTTMTKFAKALGGLLMSIGIAIITLAGGIAIAGLLLGTKGRPMVTVLAILGILAALSIGMIMLGKAEKWVDKGTRTAQGMGTAMMFVAGGLFLFALSLVGIGAMIGAGKGPAMLIGIGAMIGILGIMAVTFGILGKFASQIIKGALTAAVMAVGLSAMAWGMKKFAESLKYLSGIGDGEATRKSGKQKGKFGQMMSDIGPGLGIMAVIMVSSALLFTALGALAMTGIPFAGIGLALAIAVALGTYGKSVIKLAKAAKVVGDTDMESAVDNMVGGVLKGLISGITGALTGGEKGINGLKNAIKNTAVLTMSIGMLMSTALALSMFAKAVSAFAELDNMRVIKGYDEKTGEPRFGDTVNVKNVGKNITSTIGTFLTGLLNVTSNLTGRQAGAIDRMARALTGRRGMLRAVIDFSEVIKTYAQFGDGKNIPWAYSIETGKDEDGNPITKTVSGTVPLTKVVDNIVNSFTQFVTGLTSKSEVFQLDRSEGKKMRRLAKTLSGKNGLLSPITQFADILKLYSEFGKNGEIAYSNISFDENGEQVNEIKKVTLTNVVDNIITSFSTFVDEITSRGFNLGKSKSKKLKRLSKALSGSEGMMAPISGFAEVLQQYAKFGKAGMVPIMDAEGKPTGESVQMGTIANNVFKAIHEFMTKADFWLDDLSTKKMKRNKDKLKGVTRFITEMADLSKVATGLDTTAKAISGMANSIQQLADAMNEIDNTTLAGLNKLGSRQTNALIKMTGVGIGDAAGSLIPKISEVAEKRRERVEERREEKQERQTAISNVPAKSPEKTKQEEDERAAMLAQAIGETVSGAFRNGQFTFEFISDKSGVLTFG